MVIFNGAEGTAIELKQAAKWTRDYREDPSETDTEKIKAHFFGREILQQILEQEGCMGIRMYYALDDKRQKQLILVGVNAEGQDMVDETVADGSRVCPPDCGIESPLLN